MPTYIIQSQWTKQGIRNVKESAKRLDLHCRCSEWCHSCETPTLYRGGVSWDCRRADVNV